MDITILRLDTLEAIKRDSIDLLRNVTAIETRIEARENIEAVDRELTRRIEWANAAQVALAELARGKAHGA